jgi:hypothetical protein
MSSLILVNSWQPLQTPRANVSLIALCVSGLAIIKEETYNDWGLNAGLTGSLEEVLEGLASVVVQENGRSPALAGTQNITAV